MSMTEAITYRRAAGTADFEATYEVFLAASRALREASHREVLADSTARRTRAMAFREHAWRHDPDGFWIAEHGGKPVAFGIATSRRGFWHLNALHVLPEFQSSGIGTALLQRCLTYGRGRGVVSTVISEAAQPISNAMYARAGMYQWLPLVHVECPVFSDPRRGASPARVGRQDNATLSALESIDAVVLGFTRPVDHQFWMGLPDVTLLLTPTGYAYISSFGGIGPCAVRSPRDFPGLLAMSIQRAAETKLQHVSFVVPGFASAALAWLLGHDGRYAADMTVLLSSRPFGRLNRYLLPASDALF